jgi:hypothetical protein
MQLHAIHKKDPMKKLMGRKRNPRRRKARNITW